MRKFLENPRFALDNAPSAVYNHNGQIEVWSVELDEPIGCASSMASFRAEAKQLGWRPIN